MGTDFDLFAIAAPTGWKALDPATGATGAGPDARTALAALRPRRGARVLIASDAVFAQSVRLSPAQTAALAPGELEAALFYEVEPFCGIPRERALVAAAPLGSPGEWSVAVAAKADVEALRGAVAAARCRLAGASPLPKDAPPADTAAVLARLFPSGGPAAPVVRPPRPEVVSPRNVAVAGSALAALCAALCLLDWGWLHLAARRAAPRLAAIQAAAAANARIEEAAAAADRRVREIEEARVRRERAARELEEARGAWYRLFSALAAQAGDDFAIVAIRPSEPGPASLEGVSPSAEAASGAMARLSAALAPQGWALRPGAVRERPGGFAAFSFVVGAAGEEGGLP